MKRVQLHLLRFASLKWWTERSWKFRVQFIIGLAALSLLFLSLVAWFTYESELAKISNRFLRLQIFGPQVIFYSPTSVKFPDNSGDIPEKEINFCQFHIETRMPYGRALPNTRIKATFLTPEGTPFWILSDETGADGTFRLPIPDMPMPERVVLQIHAEDDSRIADFTAFLRTESLVPQSVSEVTPETHSDFVFDDKPLESVMVQMTNSPRNTPFPPRLASITLAERILSTPCVQMSISSESRTRHPLFLGIWHENHLLTCRPLVAGEQTRKVSLTLPETISGPLSVLLIDASISPPRVLQHELVYRLPTFAPTKATEQLHFLQEFASRMNTPQFRAEKQQLAYLPQELENPTHEDRFSLNPADMRLTPSQISVASRLIGCALFTKIAPTHRYQFPELSELNRVFNRLNHAVQFPRQHANSESETETQAETEMEILKSLLRQALYLESCILNQSITTSVAQDTYQAGLPIVYDGLWALEKTYQSEIQNFRTNTKKQLGSISCMILCCALCLIFIMILMAILGLPTDWRIWILTFGVAFIAFLLAWLIANQSDIDRNHANIRYAIFVGTPTEEIQENTEQNLKKQAFIERD